MGVRSLWGDSKVLCGWPSPMFWGGRQTPYRLRICSLPFSWTCLAANNMSVVPLPDLKPHWLSGKVLSSWMLSRLTINLAKISYQQCLGERSPGGCHTHACHICSCKDEWSVHLWRLVELLLLPKAVGRGWSVPVQVHLHHACIFLEEYFALKQNLKTPIHDQFYCEYMQHCTS